MASRLSQQQQDDFTSSRPRKVSRVVACEKLVADEVPYRNLPEHMGFWHLSQLLRVHSIAIASLDLSYVRTLRD